MLFYANAIYQPLLTSMDIHNFFDLQSCKGIGELISTSSTSSVWKQEWKDQTVYFKQYQYAESFRFFMRMSKAENEQRSYQFFRQIGISCPDVICWGEERYYGRLKTAIIVTKAVPNTISLQDLFQSQHISIKNTTTLTLKEISSETKKMIITALAMEISKLHARHFIHCDFKPRNILWQSTESQRLYFIDCPRGHQSYFFSKYSILHDMKDFYRYAGTLWNEKDWEIFWSNYQSQVKVPIVWIWRKLQKISPKK